MKEVKEMVVEVCTKVITQLAAEQKLDKNKLFIRIDLENISSKPIFSLFNQSAFIGQKTINEIIKAGGGSGFNLILGTYIKKIIRDIIGQTMNELKIKDSKTLFVLLYLKEGETHAEPTLAAYHNKAFLWSMRISEAIEAAPQT